MKQKSKYGMPTPNNRAGFEHNIFLILEDIERHKDDVEYLRNRLWAIGDSLETAIYLPNGRIKLTDIDEKLRLHSNMVNWISSLPPLKRAK